MVSSGGSKAIPECPLIVPLKLTKEKLCEFCAFILKMNHKQFK